MKTSYYAKSAKDPNAISIAGKAPDWYHGREYKKLAPKVWFFKKFKMDGDEEAYTARYKKEVLDKLDAEEVYKELGQDAVILCWETPDEFCHGHLVADWLNEKLNLNIQEL
jgi:hypothetical protein